MKNIHVLPTDKPSRLADMEGLLVFGNDLYDEARDYIQSLQPKSWTIEGQWENDKLKVTKIL